MPFASETTNGAAPAVRVQDVKVRFRTTHEKHQTLRGAVSRRAKRKSARVVEALRGVSFEVKTGSVYGVVGPNGAGKSTLFRTIAGILPPTEGRIECYGRVTPLLSLGVGFNRELTGNENILLGGLAVGLDSEEVRRRYLDIVEFCELGEALNYPMRTYSSGMFARLAFSIAAHLDPEILLIDEALSAGDARFKEKAFAKIVELCSGDCTVMLVSHGMQVVRELADTCLWIDKGLARVEGPAAEVVDAYLDEMGSLKKASAMDEF